MSALDWYDDSSPGYINQDERYRFFGGKFDGRTMSVPTPRSVVEYHDRSGHDNLVRVVYQQFKCVHVPRPMCEGPICLEIVFALSSDDIPFQGGKK